MNVKLNNVKPDFTATDFNGWFLFTWERWSTVRGNYISSKDVSLRGIKLCKMEKNGVNSKNSFLLDHDNFEQKYFHKISF